MQRSARNSALWPVVPALLFIAVAFAWPFARLCALALSRAGAPASGLSRLLTDAYDRRALFDSFAFSTVVATVAVLLCVPTAFAFARGRFRGRSLLRALFVVPLSLSGVVVGFLGVAMLGNAGALPSLLHAEWMRGSAFGLGGLAVAYLYFEVPRATLTMEAAFSAVDERLLDAARTLGANRWQVARLVLWPQCAPALRAAFGVTFSASLGSFGVALILASRFPLLPVELYRAFTGTLDDSLAAAMALVLASIAVLVLTITQGRRR